MRWVWRAETGAGKIEYSALVLVVAGIVVAVLAFGLPGDVRALYERGLCLLPSDEDCDERAAGDSDADGESGGGEDENEPGDPNEEPVPEGTESENPDGQNPDGTDDEGDPEFDWEELNEDYADYESAQQELWEAEEAETEADEEHASLEDDLLQLLKELIGLDDAEKCITEGDIVACIWTVVGFAPWGKAAKIAKRIPAVARLVSRWRGVRNTRKAARRDVSDARTRVDDAAAACRASNSFVAGSRVRLADGSYVPIERVGVGEQILAEDPDKGKVAPRRVEDTINRSFRRDMVEIEITHAAPLAPDTLHATADHPFWVGSKGEWVEAEELRVGDRLSTDTGQSASVAFLRPYEDEESVFNLSVEGISTYYVSGGGPGVLVHNQNKPCPTKTDAIKQHLTERDLDAARRELDGEVVATKPDGTPWDHVDEVQNAQRGLKNRIRQINRRLDNSRVTEAEKAELQEELSEASRLLDHSEGYVPSP